MAVQLSLRNRLRKERGKKEKTKVVTTRGIRIWSPSHVLPRATGLNVVEGTKHVAVLVV